MKQNAGSEVSGARGGKKVDIKEKIQVIKLEDATEIAINLIRDHEYGYSIDDLVVEAGCFMESRSFEIDKEIWEE